MNARQPGDILDIALPLILRALLWLIRGQSAMRLLGALEAVRNALEREA